MIPEEQTVQYGESASIECISYTAPLWTFQERPLFKKVMVDVSLIKISNVRIEDGGIYECQGSNKQNKIFWATSALTVQGRCITPLLWWRRVCTLFIIKIPSDI